MQEMTELDRFIALIGGEQNLPPISTEENVVDDTDDHTTTATTTEKDGDELPSIYEVEMMNEKYDQEAQERQRFLKQDGSEATAAMDGNVSSLGSQLANTSLRPSGPLTTRFGEVAPRGFTFVPFVAVTKFCYEFVPQQWSQPLASAFFDNNKIYERQWDLYYILSAHCQTQKPTTYVSEYQVQALLDEINQTFPKANIIISDDLRNEGMVQDFDDYPQELRPHYLGRLQSREQHDAWMVDTPMTGVASKMPPERTLEAFKAMLQAAADLGKAKSKSKQKAKLQMAVQGRQDMGKQVLRAQRRVGLMKRNEGSELEDSMARLNIAQYDPSKAVPFSLEDDPIIIAIDVEAYERSSKIITEVGVATLDTRDLRDIPPGTFGDDCSWFKYIRGRHFRIAEHKHLRNHEFLQGCPDAFEFGKSEFVAETDMPSTLNSCFHEPFSKPDCTTSAQSTGTQETRNLILLGHDLLQDIQYLRQLGFNVLSRRNVIDTMDTVIMFKHYMHDVNPTSLGRVLGHFDIVGWNLHNGGNDAVYTMQAMLAICIKAAMERGDENSAVKRQELDKQRTKAVVDAAVERREDEMVGWTLAQDEDGGVAVVPKDGDFESKTAKTMRPVHGPPRPPKLQSGLWTIGGAPLDV
ncbi:hypothetical protein LTR62_006313 [Meristemomyces frigidus]|uniref:Gfd2/YDR514C-like C-terminal domain-containing protein n=1 Tax=Meristemomyces frigidus TaxID=1508187 RepID=A0AAN7YEM3_9PEZI|nr:hypothetical protein LTR62_006313 [Meristemomyces frigidus]